MIASRKLTVSTGTARTRAAPVQPVCRPSLAVSSRVALSGHSAASASLQVVMPQGVSSGAPSRKATTMMGNKAVGGPFSPAVVVVRNIMGKKEFNDFRGKAISLHSQIIKDFCKTIGVTNKQAQGVIRLAKKNGEWLGFLA